MKYINCKFSRFEFESFVTLNSPEKVSVFPPLLLVFLSVFTFGTTTKRAIAVTKASDPMLINGR